MSMSSGVRLVVVMDPIEAINPAKDSTLAILLAAQARGWQLFYAELQRPVAARRHRLGSPRAAQGVRRSATLVRARRPQSPARLGEYDVILMRKDPPFDTEYIYSTYILDRARDQGALVCNRPQGLRDMNEKVYTAWFPECCAPTLITRDMDDMSEFLREHGKAVCKPLHGMGGRSIFVLEQGDKNRNVVFETLTDYGRRYAIVQRYLPGDRDGRRLPGDPGRRRARSLRAASACPTLRRPPRQSRGGRPRREPAAQRSRPVAVLASSARNCAPPA